MRSLIQIVLFVFPWKVRKFFLVKFFNFKIEDGARIGYSLVNAKYVVLEKNSRIGSLSMIKGLRTLHLGEEGRVGNLNWITGFPESNNLHFVASNRNPSLLVGNHAAITNRHLIDCTDLVSVGDYSTFAGFRSQIITHSIDVVSNKQGCRPVKIGKYCFVGTGSILLGGAILPDKSVLGAMSFLAAELYEEECLYAGVPARKVKNITGDYFGRDKGFVF
jgi:acetyltransferase-like isoleucine patch superfamily enzyme